MDVIAGSALRGADAVHAYQLDGNGGITAIADTDMASSNAPFWLHLDYSNPSSADWLQQTELLPDVVRNALAGESMRPRVARLGEGTMITLRSINFNSDERPDQLVAIRIFITDKLIISTRHRKVYSLDEVLNDLQSGTGPTDCGSWLVAVVDAMTDHTSEFIETLHDKIIDLEDNLVEQEVPERGALALIRKQLIVMRR